MGPLHFKKPHLKINTALVTPGFSITSYDTVAWDDKGKGVPGECPCHAPGTSAGSPRNLSIGHGGPTGDAHDHPKNSHLVAGAYPEIKYRWIKGDILTIKKSVQRIKYPGDGLTSRVCGDTLISPPLIKKTR